MSSSDINTKSLVKNISYLAENFELLVKYVYEAVFRNTLLKNKRQEIYHKVIHGLILTDSLKKLVKKIEEGNIEKDKMEISLLLAEKLGDSLLLVCEIYKIIYTDWLKYLVEPSIMHKGAYTDVEEIKKLGEMQIFVNPDKIENDTHEIVRRVTKYTTVFESYDTYMLFQILADTKTLTYIAYNKDKLVTVSIDKIDPRKELNFSLIGKALERIIIWRNQFAHFGDYLLACDEIFKKLSLTSKKDPFNFDHLKKKVLSNFCSSSPQVIKYLDRLFWHIGDALRILRENCEKIENIFNYHLQK
ncbi:MAG: hypothetical protein QXO15_01195 [Nitrososphaerota archaeon]